VTDISRTRWSAGFGSEETRCPMPSSAETNLHQLILVKTVSWSYWELTVFRQHPEGKVVDFQPLQKPYHLVVAEREKFGLSDGYL